MSAASVASEATGSLAETSVPRLIAQAWRDRTSGQLCLRRGAAERRVLFIDGSPLRVEADAGADEFAAFLEDARKITGPERLKVVRFAEERECSQAQAVMALKLLEAKDLYQALRDATRQEIVDLFEWTDGTFEWQPGPSDVPEKAKTFDPLKLLQEFLPQRWGSDRLFTDLMPQSDRRAEIAPSSRRVVAKLGKAGPLAQQIVAGINGSQSVGQLLGRCAGDPLAAATLWVLIHTEMIRLQESGEADAAAPIEFEVLVEKSASGAPAAQPTKVSAPGPSEPDAAQAPDASRKGSKSDALEAEVMDLLGRLEDISHYEALGLELDASPAEIKKAYFKAAKKYHPDTLARLGLESIRDDAALVFARIARAFEVLSDKDKKALYDDGGPEPTEIDTARLAQAETSFRKGEILLKMGNFARGHSNTWSRRSSSGRKSPPIRRRWAGPCSSSRRPMPFAHEPTWNARSAAPQKTPSRCSDSEKSCRRWAKPSPAKS